MNVKKFISSGMCLSFLALSSAAWANPYDYKVVEVEIGRAHV